jgi:AraC family transcriptional regulator
MDRTYVHTVIPNTQHFNFIDCSFIQSAHGCTKFRNIGIRYVGKGLETYTLGDEVFSLSEQRYLVGNYYANGRIDIESKQPVRGVCIDLHPSLVSEVVASYLRPETAAPDLDLDTTFSAPDFQIQLQHSSSSRLGTLLEKLDHQASIVPFINDQFDAEFFYRTAELLVQDTMQAVQQMRNIKALKHSTKLDLYKKIAFGKLYLDEYFTGHCSIAVVAKEAGVSEYHFFRLFKSIYGLSPYQYILKRRIELAKQLLAKRNCTVSEVAMLVGFADIFSFSKAFKRIEGFSPVKML